MANCMDCGEELAKSNVTGICQSCVKEKIIFMPSPERIRTMCEEIKNENFEKDRDGTLDKEYQPVVHRVNHVYIAGRWRDE